MGYLYKLTFPNGKEYIGVTRKTPMERFRGHRQAARAGNKCPVYKAWRALGEPRVAVLAIVEDGDLMAMEIRAIAAFGTLTPGGYNMTIGGESPPMTPEVARKISIANTNPSAETRAKMRAAKLALPPEHYKKIAEKRRGCKLSPEHRTKLSAALKGNKHTLGHKLSLDHRAKIGAAHKGRRHTAEHVEKIAATKRGVPRLDMRGDLNFSRTVAFKTMMSGAGNPMFGRKGELSPLHGRVPSIEERSKIAAAKALYWAKRLGRPFSLLPSAST